MKVSVEKPGSPEDIVLVHYGKKGMKWGVRNAPTNSSSSGSQRMAPRRATKTGDQAAGVKTTQSFSQRFPTGKTRAAEIHRARSATEARRMAVVLETNPTKRAKLEKEFLNHPDRAIALRYTRGEKTVLGILAGALAAPVAVVGVAGAPVAAGGALGIGAGTAAVRATRRHIERKQARGGYG